MNHRSFNKQHSGSRAMGGVVHAALVAVLVGAGVSGCGWSPEPLTGSVSGTSASSVHPTLMPQTTATPSPVPATAHRGPVVPTVPVSTEPDVAPPPPTVFDPLLAGDAQAPLVVMSREHEASCLVKVGQRFPALVLGDRDGRSVRWSEQMGPRLTLVVFWRQRIAAADEQVQRLKEEICARFNYQTVRVVTVNVGDTAEHLARGIRDLPPEIKVLWDRDGTAFAQVATDMLPRTYLLDGQGQVLWLELEYSRAMRAELYNALTYYVRKQTETARAR